MTEDEKRILQTQIMDTSIEETFKETFKDAYPFSKLAELAGSLRIPQASFQLPEIEPLHIPKQKDINGYQSAGVLVKRLAETITEWRAQLPADSQPVVLALLQSGVRIDVRLLVEESFHGLRIEGYIDGSECMLLTHQASVQLLCYVMKEEDESKRRPIGFVYDGKESQI